jgi:hypothetical protein
VVRCALGDEAGMDASLAAYAETYRGQLPHAVNRRMELRRRWVLRRAGKQTAA